MHISGSLLCHCVRPQRKRLINSHSDIGRQRPVEFVGDEKRKGKHASNNVVENKQLQEPITWSLQLPQIPVTALSQTDVFLV